MWIAILEDDPQRSEAMSARLPELCDARAQVFTRAPEMIAWLGKHLDGCRLISLDHELGSDAAGTGRTVAEALGRQSPACPIIVHTDGRQAAPMLFALEQSGWTTRRVPPDTGLGWIEEAWVPAVRELIREPSPPAPTGPPPPIPGVHVVRDTLGICGWVGSPDAVAAAGYTGQLQCADGFDPRLEELLEVKKVLIPDEVPIPPALLEEALDWLGERYRRGERSLISCSGDERRSLCLAVGLLVREDDLGFMAACEELFGAVPFAYPHPRSLVSVARACGVAIDFLVLSAIYSSDAIVLEPLARPWRSNLIQEALRG